MQLVLIMSISLKLKLKDTSSCQLYSTLYKGYNTVLNKESNFKEVKCY